MNELGPSFKLKKFHEITGLNELLEYIKTTNPQRESILME
jgi:hypothetical protein